LVSKIDHQRLRKAIFCREGDYHGAGPHLFPGVQTSVRALSGSLVAYDRGLFLLYMAEKQERKYSPSLSESPMREYEIRVLSAEHATLIIEQMNLNDCAAIRSARKMSDVGSLRSGAERTGFTLQQKTMRALVRKPKGNLMARKAGRDLTLPCTTRSP